MARHHSIAISRVFCAFAITSSFMTGCVADSEDLDPEFVLEPEYQTMGGIGTATISTTTSIVEDDCLNDSAVLSTLRTLAEQPIMDSNHFLPSMPAMPPGDSVSLPYCRRRVLSALIQCALPAQYPVVNPNTGATVMLSTFVWDMEDLTNSSWGPIPTGHVGVIGLASHWMSRALNVDEQERVTACVMARTNHNGAPIDVLLQGRSLPAYDATLRKQYSYLDSVVWGNVFTPTPSMHVCHNVQNSTCIDPANEICDFGKNCGFTDHGDCSTVLKKCANGYCMSNQISVYLKPSSLNSTCPEPITP